MADGERSEERLAAEPAKRNSPPSIESARLGGLRSAETRRRKAELRADVKAKQKFEQAAEQLAGIVIAAALGQGPFKTLSPKDRAGFAVKGLEYAVGRPRQADPETLEEEAAKGGLSIVFGAPQGDMTGTHSVDTE